MSTDLTVRRLRVPDDLPLFEIAYSWLESSPQWRQDSEGVWNALDRDSYLAALNATDRIDIGVFVADALVAIVTLTLRAPHTYEVHFEAARGAPVDAVIEAGISIREQMLIYGAASFFTWTPRWNRAVLAINRAIGFLPQHVSMWRGTTGGRPIEWVLYALTR